eukprot:TRINITY_DN22_c0_g2_i2.p1 TRINITY_DN22_c0_g2~~TRINITY_DN22_c0_g2_i2.p1  ORF type:complete len:334 (-),score=106.53 TRINITY_DN22_c0_g2_i2:82-1083(-)
MNPNEIDEYAKRKRELYFAQRTKMGACEDDRLEDVGDDRDEAKGDSLTNAEKDDEHDAKEAQRASLDKGIAESNIGYKMLLKMGWKEKTGLGKDGSGIAEPIRVDTKADRMGLGRATYEKQYTDPENIKRITLLSELAEDDEIVVKHTLKREKEEELKKVILDNFRPFYCELCDKQYKSATEFETHLSSYEHNHKKRFVEMKAMQDHKKTSNWKKKEKLNEEKEMKRYEALAKAQREKELQMELPNTTEKAESSQVSQSTSEPSIVESQPQNQSQAPTQSQTQTETEAKTEAPKVAIKMSFGLKPSSVPIARVSLGAQPPAAKKAKISFDDDD